MEFTQYICCHAKGFKCTHADDCPHGEPHFYLSTCGTTDYTIQCCKSELASTYCEKINKPWDVALNRPLVGITWESGPVEVEIVRKDELERLRQHSEP